MVFNIEGIGFIGKAQAKTDTGNSNTGGSNVKIEQKPDTFESSTQKEEPGLLGRFSNWINGWGSQEKTLDSGVKIKHRNNVPCETQIEEKDGKKFDVIVSDNVKITGTPKDDNIILNGKGKIYGNEGNDTLEINGKGTIKAGPGNDKLKGTGEGISFYGDDGNDEIEANKKNHYLDGGNGNDSSVVNSDNSNLKNMEKITLNGNQNIVEDDKDESTRTDFRNVMVQKTVYKDTNGDGMQEPSFETAIEQAFVPEDVDVKISNIKGKTKEQVGNIEVKDVNGLINFANSIEDNGSGNIIRVNTHRGGPGISTQGHVVISTL